MALTFSTTGTVKVNPCCLVYGPAKSGKTRLTLTCPKPFVVSSDRGLSSIRKVDIPFANVTCWKDFNEALAFVKSASVKDFETIVFDDITEVAEQLLVLEKPKHKNLQQAYGVLNDEMMRVIREIRAIPKQILIIAKQEKIKDEMTGGLIYSPMMPGKAVQQVLPFLIDEVYHMEEYTDPQSQQRFEVLRTKRNNQYDAGSRSGNLTELELANMTEIFRKIAS